MSESIDISGPVRELCAILDLDANDVFELKITPTEASAGIFLTNADGKKYLVPETRRPAQDVRHFKVRT